MTVELIIAIVTAVTAGITAFVNMWQVYWKHFTDKENDPYVFNSSCCSSFKDSHDGCHENCKQ